MIRFCRGSESSGRDPSPVSPGARASRLGTRAGRQVSEAAMLAGRPLGVSAEPLLTECRAVLFEELRIRRAAFRSHRLGPVGLSGGGGLNSGSRVGTRQAGPAIPEWRRHPRSGATWTASAGRALCRRSREHEAGRSDAVGGRDW